MPTPPGLTTCDTCGLPYQKHRKAAHDLKASHRAAVTAASSSRAVTGDAPPAESFGQRMARLRAEKKAQAEQGTAPADPAAS